MSLNEIQGSGFFKSLIETSRPRRHCHRRPLTKSSADTRAAIVGFANDLPQVRCADCHPAHRIHRHPIDRPFDGARIYQLLPLPPMTSSDSWSAAQAAMLRVVPSPARPSMPPPAAAFDAAARRLIDEQLNNAPTSEARDAARLVLLQSSMDLTLCQRVAGALGEIALTDCDDRPSIPPRLHPLHRAPPCALFLERAFALKQAMSSLLRAENRNFLYPDEFADEQAELWRNTAYWSGAPSTIKLARKTGQSPTLPGTTRSWTSSCISPFPKTKNYSGTTWTIPNSVASIYLFAQDANLENSPSSCATSWSLAPQRPLISPLATTTSAAWPPVIPSTAAPTCPEGERRMRGGRPRCSMEGVMLPRILRLSNEGKQGSGIAVNRVSPLLQVSFGGRSGVWKNSLVCAVRPMAALGNAIADDVRFITLPALRLQMVCAPLSLRCVFCGA